MKKTTIISGYCSIRNKKVVVDGKQVFECPSENFGGIAAAIYRHFSISYPKFHKMDNLGKLGFLSAELLLEGRNINEKYPGDQIGIILMNSASSLDTDRRHQETIKNRSEYFPSPALFVYTLPNVVIGEICIRHKFFGEGNFFVMERFNPSFMTDYLTQLIDNNIVECCIAGWVEIDGDNFESVLFLVEKTRGTETGIVNFEAASIELIYNRK